MIWLIGAGGAIGAATRFLLGIFINRRKASIFPFPTGIINLSGSFLLGVFFQLHFDSGISDGWYYFLGIGFCGAYTTFSTFTAEVVQLITEKRQVLSMIYILASTIMSLVAAFLGMQVIQICPFL